MSLDVYLTTKDVDGNAIEVYTANVTRNLNKMAGEAGIYQALWRPEEQGWTHARDISDIVEAGLNDMKARLDHYKQFNPSNGWGDYEGFIEWTENYLKALRKYPSAEISIWR